MDLRPSPSQQHLNPSRSSSLPSQVDEMETQAQDLNSQQSGQDASQRHKLDLYSIPVFLLEVIVLTGLAFVAYYAHFQYHPEPLLSGFYCDDISYRQQYSEGNFTKQFSQKENELTVTILLLALPIIVIIFCELVNSMFGALKFRQIRAICNCCKLHSITRRTFRFSAAYLLGFLMVMISCDLLATCTGRLRPYFSQDCPAAYQPCATLPLAATSRRDLSSVPEIEMMTGPSDSETLSSNSTSFALPAQPLVAQQQPSSSANQPGRIRQPEQLGLVSAPKIIVERQWIDLSNQDLSLLCQYSRLNEEVNYKFDQLAKSWPSYPAAIFTYSCLFIACYLCFVGTARPFRIISCVLVMSLILLATVFNVQLVKLHYHHWDDVVASSVLALIVVIFVLLVYLNKFRDSHYYQNQKLSSSAGRPLFSNDSFKSYQPQQRETSMDLCTLDKGVGSSNMGHMANGDAAGSSNDLAMRYFQIPRANYRGGPRPLSSLNQIR